MKSFKDRRCWRMLRHWLGAIADPVRVVRGIATYPRYFVEWWLYTRFPGAEPIRLTDTYPQLHDCTSTTAIDAHYFYVNGWAMRRIVATSAAYHMDVGSETVFANLLGAVLPVLFVDYRPLEAKLNGLNSVRGSILSLPFADFSFASVSCLHVIEHIGLGRYGDPLDPEGTKKAACELTRVLAKGGNLYVGLPVGRPRLCFNAHRIHAPETIRDYFSELELVEFSGVHDDGRFVERVALDEFLQSEYACGMFWFRRPG